MMRFRKSLKGNKLFKLVSFFILIYLVSLSDVQTYEPGGVNWAVNFVEEQNDFIIFHVYGSNIVNCKMKNETYNADIGYNASDHEGDKFNWMHYASNINIKVLDGDNAVFMPFASINDGNNGIAYDNDIRIYKTNLDNLRNGHPLILQFVIKHVKIQCGNTKQYDGNIEYWYHYSHGLGGSSTEDSYEYKYFYYDGKLRKMPKIEIYDITKDYNKNYETTTYILENYIRVKVYGLDNVDMSRIDSNKKLIRINLNSTNDENFTMNEITSPIEGEWKDSGKAQGYDVSCFYDFKFSIMSLSGYTDSYYYEMDYSSSIEWNVDLESNAVLAYLGNVSNVTVNSKYAIRWIVTVNGTINAWVYKVLRIAEQEKVMERYVNAGITWNCEGQTFTGSQMVYNPYKSDDERDVAKLVNVECQFYDDKGGFHRLFTSVDIPKLGEEEDSRKPNEIINSNGEEVEEDITPEEIEDRPKGDRDDNIDGTTQQTNDLLNELLKEFQNGRDENIEALKGILDFLDGVDDYNLKIDVRNQGIDYQDGDKTEGDIIGSIDGVLGGDGEGGLGGYGDGVGNGFGNGVGSNINQFKSLNTKDMSFTLDLTGCASMFPSLDCDRWIWTFSLYPDVSTPMGAGIHNIVVNYVRPLFLFFMWLILGINCVKDVSSYFGNNSNV